jgi:predicted nucleic acid-binding protein
VYFDSAYIAKCYVNEPDSAATEKLARGAPRLYSSLAIAEVHCVFHRQVHEGLMTPKASRHLARLFVRHADDGYWNFIPAGEPLLRRTAAMVIAFAPGLFLRAADAVHLTTAMEPGEGEIWTSDRHMLAAAPHFGLVGRSVQGP